MKDFYYKIFWRNREAMLKVDEPTIKAIELTAPGACRADARALYGKLKNGEIFGAFSEQDRETIWAKLLSCTTDCLVPSFFSFFEDVNWLKEPADCVKRLMGLSPRGTIPYTLEHHMFSEVNQQWDQCVIQESEHTFVSHPGSPADRVDLGIRQIFFSAMRNYLDMPAEPKRKNLLAKSRSKKADKKVLYEFAALAYKLGFESDESHNPIIAIGAANSFFWC
jgi:hypothetical protein